MAVEDIAKYKDLFIDEARSHLMALNKSLLSLEKNPEETEVANKMFRRLHTLKGMTATMNYDNMTRLCHSMENVLDAARNKKAKLGAAIDLLFECIDGLGLSSKRISNNEEELDTAPLVERLQALLVGDEGVVGNLQKEQNATGKAQPDTVEKISSIDVKTSTLDAIMNVTEELLIAKMRLDRITDDIESPELAVAVDDLGRLVADLQYNVMQSRMVPIGFVFDRFPRMVRDLAKQQRKVVDLLMEGSDIGLDRGVIDEIGESLVHLLRNAVDHGIESPQERKQASKPPQGTIKLIAKRTKSSAVIQVNDDGAGLDLECLRGVGERRGSLSLKAGKEEVADLIFSGLSTAKQVTEVSGRGLGLSAVKNNIESLGGNIKVHSELNKGTTFTIEIPLTLAIIKALFVSVGGRVYAIPLGNVDRLVAVDSQAIKGIMDHEAIVLNGEEILTTRLAVLFGMPPSASEKQQIVIIKKGSAKLGLVVDTLLSTGELVAKPLNKLIRENKYFSGCSIVGSGEVVLILDVANLILTKRVQATAVETR